MIMSKTPDNPTQARSPATLTVGEAHLLVGKDNISRAALYAAIAHKEIPSIRIGRRILIPRSQFAQWLGGTIAGHPEACG
jgi:excisionase family DNA binding protein